jgi:hypothetical protein
MLPKKKRRKKKLPDPFYWNCTPVWWFLIIQSIAAPICAGILILSEFYDFPSFVYWFVYLGPPIYCVYYLWKRGEFPISGARWTQGLFIDIRFDIPGEYVDLIWIYGAWFCILPSAVFIGLGLLGR